MEKWVEFRRDFYKITLAAMIAPLMYLVVFGMGIQTTSHGQPYLNFLIPGVVSLTTMNGSFNAIAQNLNVQRLYEKAFDQVMISPTPLWQLLIGQELSEEVCVDCMQEELSAPQHLSRQGQSSTMVLSCDVPQWSSIFSHQVVVSFLAKKSRRRAEIFQLHYHAYGIFM